MKKMAAKMKEVEHRISTAVNNYCDEITVLVFCASAIMLLALSTVI